jgi:hypothetical protein
MDGGGVITVDSDAIDGRRRGRRGRRWALASPIVGGFCSCVEGFLFRGPFATNFLAGYVDL